MNSAKGAATPSNQNSALVEPMGVELELPLVVFVTPEWLIVVPCICSVLDLKLVIYIY